MNKLTKNTTNTHSAKGFMGQNYVPKTTTYKDKIVIQPMDEWLFTYPFFRLGGQGLRELFGDEFLKKAGVFGEVLMADTVYDYFESTYPDPEEAYARLSDYFHYKSIFENEKESERKQILNPSFLEQIERYLYNFEEQPEHMAFWDAPIDELKRMGIANEVLNLKQ